MKEEFVDHDQMLNIAHEIEEENRTIKDLKKDYPDKVKKLEKALLIYMGEYVLKLLKTEFPDKRNYLTQKFSYPYENFNSIDDYQKPINNLKKEDFFNKLKNKCPDDEEIERTK